MADTRSTFVNNMPLVKDERMDRWFVIDYDRKTLVVPENEKIIGVKGDDMSRSLYFLFIKKPDGVELKSGTSADTSAGTPKLGTWVQYQNANGETGEEKMLIMDHDQKPTYGPDAPDAVLGTFIIPAKLCAAYGKVRLQICSIEERVPGTTGFGLKHWHTAPVEVEVAEFFDMAEE